MYEKSFKVTVNFERRADGGLRVWSEDIPGLVLSHHDVDGVLEDVKTAIRTILAHRLNTNIEVRPLEDLREVLEDGGIVDPKCFEPGRKEYVATCH